MKSVYSSDHSEPFITIMGMKALGGLVAMGLQLLND